MTKARGVRDRLLGYALIHHEPVIGEEDRVSIVIEQDPATMWDDADQLNAQHGTDYRVYVLVEVPRG